MQTNPMPRPLSDNTFQVAFKIPDSWIAMADEIAASMSRPGVTTTRTDALRAALWHGLNELRAQPSPKLILDKNRVGLLEMIARGEELQAEVEAAGTDRSEQDPTTVEAWLGEQYGAEHHGWLRRALKTLKADGYVRKIKESGYVLTPKGRAAVRVTESKSEA